MKKICVVLFVVFLLSAFAGSAQSTWQKAYGTLSDEDGIRVKQTSDRGYVVLGYTSNDSLCLLKTDSIGNLSWYKTFDTITPADELFSIQETPDSGYFIACSQSMYVIRTDKNGDTIWTKKLEDGQGNTIASDVSHTSDGDYVIAGSNHNNPGDENILLVKMNINGDTVWTKSIDNHENDRASSVLQSNDGGFVITGFSSLFLNSDSSYIFLLKTDSSGNPLWEKSYVVSGDDYSSALQETYDGGFIITGQSFNFTTSYGIILKTDASGNLIWNKAIENVGVYSVSETIDSGNVFAGFTSTVIPGSVFLLKTNANGDTVWSKVYGGIVECGGESVQQTFDGGYIVSGFTNGNGVGGFDILLIKSDDNGNSGCNEINSSVSISSLPIQVSSIVPTVSSANLSVVSSFVEETHTITDTTLCFSDAVSEISNPKSELLLSPNPASTFISVLTTDNSIHSIEIYNTFGEKVAAVSPLSPVRGVLVEADIHALPAGMYFLKVVNESGSEIIKFVKE